MSSGVSVALFTLAQQRGKSKQQAVWKTAIWENLCPQLVHIKNNKRTADTQLLDLSLECSFSARFTTFICMVQDAIRYSHSPLTRRSLQGDYGFNPEHIRGIHLLTAAECSCWSRNLQISLVVDWQGWQLMIIHPERISFQPWSRDQVSLLVEKSFWILSLSKYFNYASSHQFQCC